MEYISALIVKSQREESMKRLLEWKQRMLQSPLTRKSSRNASRTQTPTNSDSPVPSLNNDDIRKKVLEELQQPSTPTVAKERRLSRKGSSGSRSSRYTFHINFDQLKINLPSTPDDEHFPGVAALLALLRTKVRCTRVTTMVSDHNFPHFPSQNEIPQLVD